MITILGAGLAGLSVSNHLRQESILFEKNDYAGGHIHSELIDGFTWDEGPHVSFTKHKYVKDLFEFNTNNEVLDYPVKTGNYFNGNWIPHPAQTNLFAVPEPLKTDCLEGITRAINDYNESLIPKNYKEWLEFSFGEVFSNAFPAAYTRKYWTTDPENLGISWVGERIFVPNIDQVNKGAVQALPEETHYIKTVRYPRKGGYISFAKKMISEANISFTDELTKIDFQKKELYFNNAKKISYEKLVSSIPLPVLIQKSDAPSNVKRAASQLNCSSVLLINVTADHPTQRKENWMYIYDEDKYSTRINCTELLSPYNAPLGKTGIQVEVYFSQYKPLNESLDKIAEIVCDELLQFGLIKSKSDILSIDKKFVKWANVIFDNKQQEAQDAVFTWLQNFGLTREVDDLHPLTDWEKKITENVSFGDIVLAGRFGQWKYYWSDDCVLRGKFVAEKLNE